MKEADTQLTHNKNLKADLLFVVFLMVCAIGAGLIAAFGWLKPRNEFPEIWF